MSWAIVSYAFAVGMAATVNPCGAAMLPAYLTWFTRSDRPSSPAARVPRAVLAGLAVTAGFVVVFGVVGGAVSAGLGVFMDATPYIGIAVGAVLVAVGALTVAGRHVSVRLPGSARPLGGGGRGLRAMVGFGVSYGLASLGCALPVFLAGVTVAFSGHGIATGIGAFVAYALGMGAVLTALAVAVAAFPQTKLLRSLRAAGGRLERPAGVLLVLVGAYIVYYWVVGGLLSAQSDSGLIAAVDGLTATVASRLHATLGVALVGLVAVAVVVALASGRRRGRGGHTSPPGPPHDRSAAPADAAKKAAAPVGRLGGSWRTRHPRLRRSWPFAAAGIAAATVEAVILAGVLAPTGPPAAASAQPPSTGIEAMLGLDWLPPGQAANPAPFTLTDQHGQPVNLASFRGKAVVLSFNDNHCQSLCPLYAQDVRAAIADLGPMAQRVAFVGVNVNPFYPQVASDVAFDRQHGLAGLPEWYFLTGPLAQLKAVWRHYGEQPLTGADETVTHSSALEFIGPHGKIRGTGLYGTGSADATRWGYALATLAERLLGTHTPLAAHASLPPPPTPSTAAPGFSLPDLTGTANRTVSLAALRGRPVVLNFFASWCSACQAEAADVETAARRLDGRVAVVGIDINDTRPSALGYIARQHLTYPIGFDHSGSVAAAYGVTGLPTTIFISPAGRIVARHVGRITASQLDHQLATVPAR